MNLTKHLQILTFIACTAFVIIFNSCKPENSVGFNDQLTKDVAQVDQYLNRNNIAATSDPTGLRFLVVATDTKVVGVYPSTKDSILVQFREYTLADPNPLAGEDVITTKLDTTTLKLSTLIPAWQIIIPRTKTGTTIDLYVPSGLAFGAQGSTGIPPYSNLIYRIHLIGRK